MAASIDYGSIIKRSWFLVRKYKWLWVYGLVLAVFGGGGGSGSSSSGGSSSNSTNSNFIKNIPSDTKGLEQKGQQVLGDATTAISQWAAHVSPGVWILLGLVVVLLIIVAVAISIVVVNWAKAGLIYGLHEANQDKDVNLPSTSTQAIGKIKPLFKFGLIQLGLFILLLLGLGLGGGVLAFLWFVLSFSKIVAVILVALLGMALIITFIILMVIFSMVGIYADRLIVLHGYSSWLAWKKSFSLTKKSFLSIVVMGIINSIVGCASGCLSILVLGIVLAIPGFLLLMPVFSKGISGVTPGIVVGSGIIIFIFVQFNLLFRALFVVFNYSNWNLFMDQALKEEQL